MPTRRQFLSSAAATAFAASARSYSQIAGSNDRLNFAVIGLNSRAYAHLDALADNRAHARITHVCDVESNILAKFAASTEKQMGAPAASERDFRRILERKEVDAVTIATPDHWHAPMAIAALAAGKHVYLEKPCSHNPHEGELLLAARRRYGKLVQLGTQQRSSPHTIEVIGRIHAGLIGRPYFAKCWYSNTRKSIGTGTPAPVPATLDWDLWQGPAPRRPYMDNVQPYNWHWFRHWGTGETLNNGTHEVDVARWALGVDYPRRVAASGGRYHFQDDWQFYDTLLTSFEYEDKQIAWECTSCQGMLYYGRSRGVTILGTEGTVLVDRDGYEVYDLKGAKTAEVKAGTQTSTTDTVGRDSMTASHFANLIAGIRSGETLRAPIETGNVAVTMLHLSNIAWYTGRVLTLDPATAHILDDSAAMQYWQRQYEPGWEPKV